MRGSVSHGTERTRTPEDNKRPNGTFTKCCFIEFCHIVVLDVGFHHVFKGPVRVYCTGLCFQANIVEEGVTLSTL